MICMNSFLSSLLIKVLISANPIQIVSGDTVIVSGTGKRGPDVLLHSFDDLAPFPLYH